MKNCHVFNPKHARGEDQVGSLDFAGNKPALPPLTTEAVTSVIYLEEEEEPRT